MRSESATFLRQVEATISGLMAEREQLELIERALDRVAAAHAALEETRAAVERRLAELGPLAGR
jgi:hypothetical protein